MTTGQLFEQFQCSDAEKRHGASCRELVYLTGVIESYAVETEVLYKMYEVIKRMAPRTKEVIELVAQGYDTITIAKKMGIKNRTVLNLKTWGIWHLKEYFGTTDMFSVPSIKSRQVARWEKSRNINLSM